MSTKVESSLKKVIKFFNKKGFNFECEDNMEDHLDYQNIEGHDVIIGDDTNREQWCCELSKIVDKDGKSLTHVDLTNVLIEVFGLQSKIHNHPSSVVNNWEPKKNLLIVHRDDSIEFFQYYTKR